MGGTLELKPNSIQFGLLERTIEQLPAGCQSAVKSSTSIKQTFHEIRKSSAVGIANQILLYPEPFPDDLGNLRCYWPTNSPHFRHKNWGIAPNMDGHSSNLIDLDASKNYPMLPVGHSTSHRPQISTDIEFRTSTPKCPPPQ